MCKTKKCSIASCWCCRVCYCEQSCYLCKTRDESALDVRNKFVCFPCKRVWKSPISKYICQQVNSKFEGYKAHIPNLTKINANIKPNKIDTGGFWKDYLEMDWYDDKEPSNTNPYTTSEKRKLRKVIINDFTSNYSDYSYRPLGLSNLNNSKAKCAKCGNLGRMVGRNFAHCKTDKAWKQLETQVQKGEIDLFNDFYDYPRELNLNKTV